MQREEKYTELLAFVVAFGVVPFAGAVAGFMFGPVMSPPSPTYTQPYDLMDSLRGAIIGGGGLFVISGVAMYIRAQLQKQTPHHDDEPHV